MTTFDSRQSDCGQRVRKMANARGFNSTPQIAPSICTVRFTKHDKSDATIFKSLCKRTVVCKCFYRVQALPLVRTRFLRLAKSLPKIARSPTRWSRDGRGTSGKKSGEMSHVVSAQRPGNGRTVATAMPPNIRQRQLALRRTWTRNVRAGNLRDNSQLGRATAAKHLPR